MSEEVAISPVLPPSPIGPRGRPDAAFQRGAMAVLALAAVLAACGGQLRIRPFACDNDAECGLGEACQDGVCVHEQSLCAPQSPQGVCPDGSTCSTGACVPEGWCDCPEPQQGCLEGLCVAVDSTNRCEAARPAGACRGGEVCVGGHCVPIQATNVCATQRPRGLCPAGLTCVDAHCEPTAERPCTPSDTEGRCPPGQGCNATGVCEPVSCSLQNPAGACGSEQMCDGGTCVPVPCSPFHPLGACPPGDFCSSAGSCLTEGSCLADEDCQPGHFCSHTQQCLPVATCAVDEDCDPHYRCEDTVCVRDYRCVTGDDCLDEEKCSVTAAECIASDACLDGNDCPWGQFCSAAQVCVDNGLCAHDDDCDNGQYCSANGMCMLLGQCRVDADCPPLNTCVQATFTCTPVGAPCTSNLVMSGCEVGVFACCPDGEVCCGEVQRCSVDAGTCVPVGACHVDADCPPSHLCNAAACEPSPSRSCDAGCADDEICSAAGVCIPQGTCTSVSDCEGRQRCGPAFICVPEDNCGAAQLAVELIPPNLMIVLDRSGSMNYCDDDDVTRWDEANQVISALLSQRRDLLRFGLTTFPKQCEGTLACTEQCANPLDACNGTFCTCQQDAAGTRVCIADPDSFTGNREPGTVNVPTGPGTADAVDAALVDIHPGGATTTGSTLRNIVADPGAFGLVDEARRNVVLLITDGEANRDYADDIPAVPTGTCGPEHDGADAACKVNSAIHALRGLSPPVTTYVVGFTIEDQEVKNYLKCHAVVAGTSRCADTVDLTNCGENDTPDCHYQADNVQALSRVLGDIAGRVTGCTYSLEAAVTDVDRLYVYFDYGADTLPVFLPRDASHQDRWDVDLVTQVLSFYGAACESLRDVDIPVTPLVIFGCPDAGG